MNPPLRSEVSFEVAGAPTLSAIRLEGRERLGEISTFELDLRGALDTPVRAKDVLYKTCRLTFGSLDGSRQVVGVVTRFAVAMSDHAGTVAYKVTMRSAMALLELKRMARTFGKKAAKTVPDIIEQIVKTAGYTVRRHLMGQYAPVPYIVQYQETDAAFVRRLCEEHGLFFRFEATAKGEQMVLEDDTREAEEGVTTSLTVVSREARSGHLAVGFEPRFARARRAGKVTLRDYDPDHPDVPLEGTASAGVENEKTLDHYRAPGGFFEPSKANARAQLWLDALRAEGETLRIKSTVFGLFPGQKLTVAEAPDYTGLVKPAGDYSIVGVRTTWHADVQADPNGDHVLLELVPLSVPFRLPAVTPQPHIAGVQSAWVAGKPGQEIDPDELGRVYVRFHWDVHSDHPPHENPPFRVMQPELNEGLVVPRVGWEVFMAFEDGDPARPHLLGRTYNKKQPPAQALPANKTISSIATDSSPGAGARTVIQTDDASGREHLLWNAPYDMKTTIVNDRTVETKKNENEKIKGTSTTTVGALDMLSIDLAWLSSFGSRLITALSTQHITVAGNYGTKVGPDMVFVGGMVGEQVGNPVNGLKNLAVSAALAAIGTRGLAGQVVAAGIGLGRGAYEGYKKGGWSGAAEALGRGAAGMALSFVPGGDALTSAGWSGWAHPWDHGRPSPGPAEPGGGGAGAAGGNAGPVGPGPGWRVHQVSGFYFELVGAAYGIATGAVSWATVGPSIVYIRGSHTSRAVSGGMMVAGGMTEKVGSTNVDSQKTIEHTIKGALTTNIKGPLTINAGKQYQLNAKASMTLKVTGTLQIGGATVTFKVGSAEVSTSSSGVLIKAGNIKVKKLARQSGSLTHS